MVNMAAGWVKVSRKQSWKAAEAHRGLGLVWLQVAHEVQRLQHLIHLPLALLCAAGSAEEGVLLVISYLLPVALLQQSITQHWYLQCTATVLPRANIINSSEYSLWKVFADL